MMTVTPPSDTIRRERRLSFGGRVDRVYAVLDRLSGEDILALYHACTEAQMGSQDSLELFAMYFGPAESLADYSIVSDLSLDYLPISVQQTEFDSASRELECAARGGRLPRKVTRLYMLRKRRGLTQQQLADASGVNIRQIQKYESVEYEIGNMTLKTAAALSSALDVTIEELLHN